jgi:lysine-specific demethylase/histidyl-hydroxylase NO66
MGTMHQLDDDDGGTLPEGLKQMSAALKSAGVGQVDEDALVEFKAQQRIRAQQQHFKEEAKKRIMRVCKQAMSMLDDACDQIGKRFLSDRLPPALLEPERSLTKEAFANKGANYHDAAKKIWPNTLCRLVRPGIARLVIEDSHAILYHCNDNSRVFHGTPLSPMEFEIDDAPALEQLLTTVEPHWIMVKDLIHGDIEDKMEIAQALYDEGILATILTESPDRSVHTG